MGLIYGVLATVVGGIIVWFSTRPGGLLSQIDPQILDGLRTRSDFNEGSVQVGSPVGSSPFQTGRGNISTALGAAGLGQSAAASGALGATVSTSAAVPIAGAAIAGAAAIWGIIQAHHARAVAAEASALNSAVPHFRQTLVQVCSAVMSGQITDQASFNGILDGLVSDYYTEVRGIIRGRWPANVSSTPNPCNGPCVVGHWWIEGDAQTLKTYDGGFVNAVRAGRHNHIALSEIPSHAGFNGAPSITINY